ncbi:MAG: hypothetical protein ACTSO2_19770 [Promethearchaeota archaeon]
MTVKNNNIKHAEEISVKNKQNYPEDEKSIYHAQQPESTFSAYINNANTITQLGQANVKILFNVLKDRNILQKLGVPFLKVKQCRPYSHRQDEADLEFIIDDDNHPLYKQMVAENRTIPLKWEVKMNTESNIENSLQRLFQGMNKAASDGLLVSLIGINYEDGSWTPSMILIRYVYEATWTLKLMIDAFYRELDRKLEEEQRVEPSVIDVVSLNFSLSLALGQRKNVYDLTVDMQSIKTKISQMATKKDLEQMATKKDLEDVKAQMATKKDLHSVKTEIDSLKNILFQIKDLITKNDNK